MLLPGDNVPMNDIRDALRKAGLVNDKDEKRYRHEERVRKKKLGREGREAERRDQEDRGQQRTEAKKQEVKQAQDEHDRVRRRTEERRSLLSELASQAVPNGLKGPRRFHYREPDGHLPYVGVNDDISRRLEGGELALVRHPEPPHALLLVPRALAETLARSEPERVLHFAGR